MSYVNILHDLEQYYDVLQDLQADVIRARDAATGEEKTKLRRVSMHLDNVTNSIDWALCELDGDQHEPLVRAQHG